MIEYRTKRKDGATTPWRLATTLREEAALLNSSTPRLTRTFYDGSKIQFRWVKDK